MKTGIRYSLLVTTFVIFHFCLTVVAQAESSESDEATSQLNQRLNAIKSFQGSFIQLTLDEDGEALQRQSGTTAMVRPNSFLWHVEKPYVQVMVLHNDVVSIYEPDLEQISHSPMEDTVDTSVIALLFDENHKEISDYEVSQLSNGYKLEPRADIEVPLTSIEIYFEDGRLIAIDVVDVQGQRTEFSFTEMTFNQFVSESRFTIEVPDTTEVIGTPPSSPAKESQHTNMQKNTP